MLLARYYEELCARPSCLVAVKLLQNLLNFFLQDGAILQCQYYHHLMRLLSLDIHLGFFTFLRQITKASSLRCRCILDSACVGKKNGHIRFYHIGY